MICGLQIPGEYRSDSDPAPAPAGFHRKGTGKGTDCSAAGAMAEVQCLHTFFPEEFPGSSYPLLIRSIKVDSSNDRCNLPGAGDTDRLIDNIADPAVCTSGNNNLAPGRPVHEGGVVGKQIRDFFTIDKDDPARFGKLMPVTTGDLPEEEKIFRKPHRFFCEPECTDP